MTSEQDETPKTWKWTSARKDILYAALDDIAGKEKEKKKNEKKTTLKQALDDIEAYFQAEEEEPRPSRDDIKTMVNVSAKKVRTNSLPLVQQWDLYKEKVKGSKKQKGQASKSRTNKSGPANSSASGTEDEPLDNNSASRAEDYSDAAQGHGTPDASSSGANDTRTHRLGGSNSAPLGGAGSIANDYARIEREVIDVWGFSGLNRKSGNSISTEDAEEVMNIVLRHIRRAVASFCDAQPFTHLTATHLTRPTLELTQLVVYGDERASTDLQLRTIFGDPLLTKEIVLYGFAAAAVTHWVFSRDFGSFPEKRPAHTKTSLNGNFLELCKKRE